MALCEVTDVVVIEVASVQCPILVLDTKLPLSPTPQAVVSSVL